MTPSRTPTNRPADQLSSPPAAKATTTTTRSHRSRPSSSELIGAPIAQPIPPAGTQCSATGAAGTRRLATNATPPVSAPTTAATPSRANKPDRQSATERPAVVRAVVVMRGFWQIDRSVMARPAQLAPARATLTSLRNARRPPACVVPDDDPALAGRLFPGRPVVPEVPATTARSFGLRLTDHTDRSGSTPPAARTSRPSRGPVGSKAGTRHAAVPP
ncbi:MAG TPA: hypothetical protein VH352_24790, partial [Pseudonocardiaceae bacterium]|nr:hypothetical protein [Pseudonocardiaceae bacterium]